MRRENPSSQNLIFTDDRMYLIDLNDLVYAPKEAELRAFYGRMRFLGEVTELCEQILFNVHTVEEYAHYLGQVDDILEDVRLR